MSVRGGIVTVPRVVHPVTLCRFDHKPPRRPKTGPFIPTERRLANMEISEFKVVTFGPLFGNREYDRPHDTFWSTLSGLY